MTTFEGNTAQIFEDPASHVGLAAARAEIGRGLADGTSPQGLPAALALQRGSMTLFLYEPEGVDHQTPHEQDEIYIVQRGSGVLLSGPDETALVARPFAAGDAMFVPAGLVHRFVEFTADFSVWVVMYGPAGGETRP